MYYLYQLSHQQNIPIPNGFYKCSPFRVSPNETGPAGPTTNWAHFHISPFRVSHNGQTVGWTRWSSWSRNISHVIHLIRISRIHFPCEWSQSLPTSPFRRNVSSAHHPCCIMAAVGTNGCIKHAHCHKHLRIHQECHNVCRHTLHSCHDYGASGIHNPPKNCHRFQIRLIRATNRRRAAQTWLFCQPVHLRNPQETRKW